MRGGAIILLAATAACAQAQDMGRLFYTPEQRAQLDHDSMRKPNAKIQRPATLTLNGIVQRSDGVRTVWINGAAQIADGSGKRRPDVHAVNVPGTPQPIDIKVGQHLMLEQPASE